MKEIQFNIMKNILNHYDTKIMVTDKKKLKKIYDEITKFCIEKMNEYIISKAITYTTLQKLKEII
jgi:hypothetical protein